MALPPTMEGKLKENQMKKCLIGVVFASLLASPAFAQSPAAPAEPNTAAAESHAGDKDSAHKGNRHEREAHEKQEHGEHKTIEKGSAGK